MLRSSQKTIPVIPSVGSYKTCKFKALIHNYISWNSIVSRIVSSLAFLNALKLLLTDKHHTDRQTRCDSNHSKMKLFTAIFLAARAIMGADAVPYTGIKTMASTYPLACLVPTTDAYVIYPVCVLTSRNLPSATAPATGPGTTLH